MVKSSKDPSHAKWGVRFNYHPVVFRVLLLCGFLFGPLPTLPADARSNPPAAPYSDSISKMTPLGHIGGPAYSVAVEGEILFAGIGNELSIFDLSKDKTNRIGYIILPAPALNIEIEWHTAYIAAGDEGLILVDISDLTQPRLVGSYQTAGPVQAVAVYGNRALIAAGTAGLRMVDISNPALPVETVSYAFPQPVTSVDGDNRYAYVAAAKFYVVDTWIPGPGAIIGEYGTTDKILEVTVRKKIAYLAAGEANLQILGLDHPDSPSLLSVFKPEFDLTQSVQSFQSAQGRVELNGVYHLSVNGDYAYASTMICYTFGKPTCYKDQAAAVKIKDPRMPVQVPGSQVYLMGVEDVQSLSLAGTTAYIAQDTGGLQRVDFRNARTLEQIGVAGSIWHVQDKGGYTFTGVKSEFDDSFWVFDTRNLRWPVPAGSMRALNLNGFLFSSDILYLLYYGPYLVIKEASNPYNLVWIKPFPLANEDYPFGISMAIQGNYIYLILSDAGRLIYRLDIVDISDPVNPKEVGYLDLKDIVHDLAVSGRYAFIGGDSQIQILDISNPLAPIEVGSFSTLQSGGCGIYDLAVKGALLYAANDNCGMTLIDFSDPANPVKIGGIDQLGQVQRVAQAGEYALAGNKAGDLWLMDVSNPAEATTVRFYQAKGEILDISFWGNDAYVGSRNGFFTFRILSSPVNIYLPRVFK